MWHATMPEIHQSAIFDPPRFHARELHNNTSQQGISPTMLVDAMIAYDVLCVLQSQRCLEHFNAPILQVVVIALDSPVIIGLVD